MRIVRRSVALGTLLLSTTLTMFAQVVPAPTTPAPTQIPGNVPRPSTNTPGQIPGRTQPGQVPGRTAPNQTGLPGRTGTGQPTGNQTQGGRTQTGTDAGGRTQTGNTPTDAEGSSEPTRERRSDSDDPNAELTEDQQREQVENSAEALRRREAEEQRRKVFGYEIFNDPNLRSTFQPNLRIATPAGYVIGPDDQLVVEVYGYSEQRYDVEVNPDGYVYIERVGPIHVSGLTIEQAKARISGRLAKIFVGLRNSAYGPANTFLNVRLGNLRSIRVTILGEAARPGTYTLSSLSTAMNAIYEAGGPNVIGSYRNVQVVRNNRVISTLDLYDLLTTGVQRNNVRLQDNDIIRFTTFRSRVEITGSVKRNNIFELSPGETMARLLSLAGGFNSNAYRNRLKVTRFTNRELKVFDVTEPEFDTFTLQDGDNIAVEQVLNRFENQISVQGAVYRPGTYALDQNKTLTQLLKSAEGLRGDAFSGRINIIRTRDDMAVENISLNLANIINGVDPDVELKREDQIIIPSRFEMAEQATVSISGEVNIPIGEEPYTSNMSLEDLIVRAGGLRESAAASQIEVVRRKKDVDPTSTTAQIAQVYRFDVNRDLSIKPTDTKFVLEPFDQIIVRRSPNYREQTFANIEGEVVIPGQYAIKSKDQRISDLIREAGGLTPYAYVEGATLVRTVVISQQEAALKQEAVEELANDTRKAAVDAEQITPVKQEPIGISLRKILERPGSSEDMLLQEGDVLRIPKRLETVRVQGEVLLPTTVKYRNGQTFQDYISQAGGFTGRSSRKRAYVVYANGSADRTRKFGFFNVYPRVEPGAEIVVPQKTTGDLTPRQVLSEATGIVSSVMTLILAVLAFRSIR